MKRFALVFTFLLFPAAAILFVTQFPLSKTSTPAQAQTCRGTISVTNAENSFEFRSSGTFNVAVENNGIENVTVTVVDEIWQDQNCNGVEDRRECSEAGYSEPCGWGVTNAEGKRWEGVNLGPGGEKTLTWQKDNWIPGYCYLHTVYFYSTPLNDTNPCWQGFDAGWKEADHGNLQFKPNQARFEVESNLQPEEGTAYGFCHHLLPDGEGTSDLERFKDDIYQVEQSSDKLRLFRVAVAPWDIVRSTSPDQIVWEEAVLEDLAEAVDYAYNYGFSVILTLYPLDSPSAWGGGNYDQAKYEDYVYRYYRSLAQELTLRGVLEKIYAWSPWNEVNHWCFTNFIDDCATYKQECSQQGTCGKYPNYFTSDEYADSFYSALSSAKSALESVDPNVKIMPHSGYYRWYFLTMDNFEEVKDQIDGIGLSYYPRDDEFEINRMGEIVDYLRYKTDKPVFLLETGCHEEASYCTEEDGKRSERLVSYFSQLKNHAKTVTLYKFNDGTKPEFGIRRVDGTFKDSFYALRDFVDRSGILLPLFGDLDGNGQVNFQDLKIILQNYGPEPFEPPEADLNGDGLVNGVDFGEILKLVEGE